MEAGINAVSQVISDFTGETCTPVEVRTVGGGSISTSFTLTSSDQRQFFVKRNRSSLRPMFVAELDGLQALQRCPHLRIPTPIGLTDHDGYSYLILEQLRLGGQRNGARLGHAVAGLHRLTDPHFGWDHDNFIGSTPQINQPRRANWVSFYRDCRLDYQRQLAQRNGAPARMLDAVARLADGLDGFFTDYHPQPALLHGDLWSGNWAFLSDGTPVLFDPAVYFGDREADIAMMELFGHPGADFFAAYNEQQPLAVGYPVRRELYNLYHILNHFNLFGGSYGSQAERMARQLLAELG